MTNPSTGSPLLICENTNMCLLFQSEYNFHCESHINICYVVAYTVKHHFPILTYLICSSYPEPSSKHWSFSYHRNKTCVYYIYYIIYCGFVPQLEIGDHLTMFWSLFCVPIFRWVPGIKLRLVACRASAFCPLIHHIDSSYAICYCKLCYGQGWTKLITL